MFRSRLVLATLAVTAATSGHAQGATIHPGLQTILKPDHDRDRGPVVVFAPRAHLEL